MKFYYKFLKDCSHNNLTKLTIPTVFFLLYQAFLMLLIGEKTRSLHDLAFSEFPLAYLNDFANISDILQFNFEREIGHYLYIPILSIPIWKFFDHSVHTLDIISIFITSLYIIPWFLILRSHHKSSNIMLSLLLVVPLPMVQVGIFSIHYAASSIFNLAIAGYIISLIRVKKIRPLRTLTLCALTIFANFSHPLFIVFIPAIWFFIWEKSQLHSLAYIIFSLTAKFALYSLRGVDDLELKIKSLSYVLLCIFTTLILSEHKKITSILKSFFSVFKYNFQKIYKNTLLSSFFIIILYIVIIYFYPTDIHVLISAFSEAFHHINILIRSEFMYIPTLLMLMLLATLCTIIKLFESALEKLSIGRLEKGLLILSMSILLHHIIRPTSLDLTNYTILFTPIVLYLISRIIILTNYTTASIGAVIGLNLILSLYLAKHVTHEGKGIKAQSIYAFPLYLKNIKLNHIRQSSLKHKVLPLYAVRRCKQIGYPACYSDVLYDLSKSELHYYSFGLGMWEMFNRIDTNQSLYFDNDHTEQGLSTIVKTLLTMRLDQYDLEKIMQKDISIVNKRNRQCESQKSDCHDPSNHFSQDAQRWGQKVFNPPMTKPWPKELEEIDYFSSIDYESLKAILSLYPGEFTPALNTINGGN